MIMDELTYFYIENIKQFKDIKNQVKISFLFRFSSSFIKSSLILFFVLK